MNLLSLSLKCSSHLAFCVSQDSDELSLLDSESLAVMRQFNDGNQFARNCLAVAEPLECFVTFSRSKSVFSFWHFNEVT